MHSPERWPLYAFLQPHTRALTSLMDQSPCILIVDDRQPHRVLLRAQLEDAGYTNIVESAYGKKALAMLGLGESPDDCAAIDLVILDVLLPDIDGYQVCRTIKKELSPLFPVIMLTGLQDVTNHVRGIEAGADDFFTKLQYHPEELSSKIDMLMKYCPRLREVEEDEALTLAHIRSRPSPGDSIGGYCITETLGWGGGTLVYRAEHVSSGAECVIKLLSKHMTDDWSGQQRFTREIKVMQRLQHPNLIPVLDDGRHEGCPYYVMEFLQGQDLFEQIVSGRPAKCKQVRRVANDVAEALEYVHKNNIIHRDVKPRNIFVCRDSSVKLGDFGVARFGESQLTQSNIALGTPVYMPPEQFTDAPLTAAADIYAFGATLYHLICGRAPFHGLDTYELYQKHLTERPPALKGLVPSLPDEWEAFVCRRCMAKIREERPKNMAAVIEELAMLPEYE